MSVNKFSKTLGQSIIQNFEIVSGILFTYSGNRGGVGVREVSLRPARAIYAVISEMQHLKTQEWTNFKRFADVNSSLEYSFDRSFL